MSAITDAAQKPRTIKPVISASIIDLSFSLLNEVTRSDPGDHQYLPKKGKRACLEKGGWSPDLFVSQAGSGLRFRTERRSPRPMVKKSQNRSNNPAAVIHPNTLRQCMDWTNDGLD